MARGYGGRYQGRVVDDQDPLSEHRLRVMVPEVWGDNAESWAKPSLPPGSTAIPAVGDYVWVTFETGDSDLPIWEHADPPDPDAELHPDDEPAPDTRPRDSYVGRYRAFVVDDMDPLEEHRLNVKVPEVMGDESAAWAKAGPGMVVGDPVVTPAIGSEVWIEFENGSLEYPTWVGVV